MAKGLTMEHKFPIVDTHCHLWQVDLVEKAGMGPEFGVMHATYTPKDLAAAAREVGTRMFVLVESGRTAEDASLIQRHAETDIITAFMPFQDLTGPTLEKDLDRWQQHHKFRGVRMGFEGNPDPDALKNKAVLRGLEALAERGLVFEFLVRVGHLRDVVRIYERIPELKGIIEHMAKPEMAHRSEDAAWREGMAALAGGTPALCKLSLSPRGEDIMELLAHPKGGIAVDKVKPYVQFLLECFGPDRLAWGSDWPVALLESDYTGAFRAMQAALGPLSTKPRSSRPPRFASISCRRPRR